MSAAAETRRSLALGSAVLLGGLALYALTLLAFGWTDSLVEPGAPAGLHQTTRMNLVMLALIAFTCAVSSFELHAGRRDLRQLEPILTLDRKRVAALVESLERLNPHGRLLAILAGVLLGVGVQLLGARGDWRGQLDDTNQTAQLVLMMLLFGLLGLRTYQSVVGSRIFATLGREHARIPLFDPAPRAVFARRGLRLSLNWFVGSAIASLLFLDSDNPIVVASLIATTLALGFGSLVMPMRGIHAAVRAAKRAELERTRHEIALAGDALFREAPDDRSARLPALIAYEARVQDVREWPLDASTIARFAALALLAAGSWIGGAVVERALGSLLGG